MKPGLQSGWTALMRPLAAAEIQRLWAQPRLRWIALVTPVLLALVLGAWYEASAVARQRLHFAEAERARWLAQGHKDPHGAAHFGVWAVKPASPLAVLAPGIEPFVGLAVWLEAHKRNEMIFRPRQDADPVMRGASSAGQMIELLGPLIAILLGFSGFAQERERGTLRMALANGAGAGRIMLVRFAVNSAILVAVLLLPVMAAGALALLSLPGGAMWQGTARLLLWSALNLIYLETFLLIALAVSLKAGRARLALTILLALWFILCIVLPRAASNTAQAATPIPSYQEVRMLVESQAPAYENADRWDARKRALLAAKPQEASRNMRAAQLDQAERDSHAVFDRLLGRFYDAVERQDHVYGRFAALSPTIALQVGASGMAGTDFMQHRHFIDAAEDYRRNLVNRLNGELMRHNQHDDAGAATGTTYWASIPAFDYRAPSLSHVLSALAVPLMLMLAWAAAAAFAAWSAVRKVAA